MQLALKRRQNASDIRFYKRDCVRSNHVNRKAINNWGVSQPASVGDLSGKFWPGFELGFGQLAAVKCCWLLSRFSCLWPCFSPLFRRSRSRPWHWRWAIIPSRYWQQRHFRGIWICIRSWKWDQMLSAVACSLRVLEFLKPLMTSKGAWPYIPISIRHSRDADIEPWNIP